MLQSLTQNTTEDKAALAEEMLVLIIGQLHARAIYVATKLGVPDLLVEEPRTADDLAAELNVDATNLHRLLRMLTMQGIFRQTSGNAFALTPRSAMLRQDTPYSLAKFALMLNDVCYDAIANLEHSVRTGEAAFDDVHGTSFFDYLGANPQLGHLFGEAMTDYGTKVHGGVMQAYDFSEVSSICDVGGSYGILLGRILDRYPHIDAALFDLPAVIDGAHDVLQEMGIAEHIKPIAGDFFESVPQGYEVYILASIIHDWDDERATQILQNVRAAMPDDGRVLILDTVIKPQGEHVDFAKMLDVLMMSVLHGRERTEDEFRTLLAGADLDLVRIHPTLSPGSIVEAVPMR